MTAFHCSSSRMPRSKPLGHADRIHRAPAGLGEAGEEPLLPMHLLRRRHQAAVLFAGEHALAAAARRRTWSAVTLPRP